MESSTYSRARASESWYRPPSRTRRLFRTLRNLAGRFGHNLRPTVSASVCQYSQTSLWNPGKVVEEDTASNRQKQTPASQRNMVRSRGRDQISVIRIGLVVFFQCLLEGSKASNKECWAPTIRTNPCAETHTLCSRGTFTLSVFKNGAVACRSISRRKRHRVSPRGLGAHRADARRGRC